MVSALKLPGGGVGRLRRFSCLSKFRCGDGLLRQRSYTLNLDFKYLLLSRGCNEFPKPYFCYYLLKITIHEKRHTLQEEIKRNKQGKQEHKKI